jgi:hypothetical protein
MECNGNYKVGISVRPEERRNTIQTSHANKVKLMGTFEPEDAYESERKVHNRLKKHNLQGEWFDGEELVFREVYHTVANVCQDPDTSAMTTTPDTHGERGASE